MESNFEWITANGDIGIRFFHSIDDGGYSNPPHWHNDLEIIYLLEGRLKVRFGDGGERQIGADELLVINSGTIHAVTAYPNQAIVLQVPYEMLLQYMEHYDQLYFVVDERPASEAEKQKLAEFKAVLREITKVLRDLRHRQLFSVMLLNIPHDLADLLYGLLILRNVFFSDPHRIVHQ